MTKTLGGALMQAKLPRLSVSMCVLAADSVDGVLPGCAYERDGEMLLVVYCNENRVGVERGWRQTPRLGHGPGAWRFVAREFVPEGRAG